MPREINKALASCWNIIKYLLHPLRRMRKLRKSNMRQFRLAMGVVAVMACIITFLLYYWHNTTYSYGHENFFSSKFARHIIKTTPMRNEMGTPFRHMPLNEIYKDGNVDDKSLEAEKHQYAMFINTPGCQIPVAMVAYKNSRSNKSRVCGKRAVFITKVSGDEVKITIKEKIVKTYLRKSPLFECCFRFILPSTRIGEENRKIRYTPCKKFQDGATISLQTDFVNIKCFELRNNTTHEVYDDVFAFTKMTNATRKPSKPCNIKYNVILLGIDSMSLSRISQLMPRTVIFFQENYWLAYRAFHKIGANTLPNLMAALTGHNMSTIDERCAGKMDKCKDMLIWSQFEEIGYITAYGEDYLRLPDTFHGDYEFKKFPTHHYLRPLYLKGETVLFNDSLVCAGKVPSAQHLLDYAFDFAMTYREESFFGVFWINSYSHNENSRPQDVDKLIENFLNRLTYTGILDNTFVVFFSDHGVRFGKYRMPAQAYYEERLPFLFIWAPVMFKAKYTPLFNALAFNRYKLVTPYDLYNTLVDIHSASICEKSRNNTDITSVAEGCPKCHSLFKTVSANRTCQDAAISDKWCSCHKMYPLDIEDTEASKSVLMIVSYITAKSKTVKAKRCWSCVPLTLRNVIRIHFYYDDSKVNLYHVVALAMTPGNMSYEGVVLRSGEHSELLESISVISPYRGLGWCAANHKDRVFCVCQKMQKC